MKNGNAVLIPLGVGLILGALSLFPGSIEKYLAAGAVAEDRSIEADAIYDGWRGTIIIGNFYHETIATAAENAAQGRVSDASEPLPQDVQEVARSGATALGIPEEHALKQFREIRERIFRIVAAEAVGPDAITAVIERLRNESPVDTAVQTEMGREADKAKAKARAAQSRKKTAGWILSFNLILLGCTIGAGVAMLWTALKEGELHQETLGNVEETENILEESDSCSAKCEADRATAGLVQEGEPLVSELRIEKKRREREELGS